MMADAGRILHDLVAVPSVTGNEAAAVGHLQGVARSLGLGVRTDAAGNFRAVAGDGPLRLMFVGHIDTVPGDIPVRIENGVLWGRGAVDAKGPLVAALVAATDWLNSTAATIEVVGAVGEEGLSPGALLLASEPAPDAVVIGEPSGWDGITVGYRGILRGLAHATQDAQHGAHAGADAVDRFMAWWSAVRAEFRFGDGFEEVSGRLHHVASSHDGLHDRIEAELQLRLPPGLTPQAAEARLVLVGERHGVQVTCRERLAAVLCEPRSTLVSAYRGAIRQEGGTPHLKRKTGTADLNILAAAWPSVPMCAYGPGDAALDHTPNEHIRLEDLARGIAVHRAAWRAWVAAHDGRVQPTSRLAPETS
jgi:[amino group carrier protein]-lysine/ornithine hydrolase